MNRETYVFLSKCKKYGIKRVAIGIEDKRVPASIDWPFSRDGDAFQWPTDKEYGYWPAIWQVCTEMNYHECGNHAQHNVSLTLEKGYYWLDKKGKWRSEVHR